jgi:pyruvate-formate lyase
MDRQGRDATNLLSFMFLRAQEHVGLPQPNLSARVWSGSPEAFVDYCATVIGRGSGMPQIVSDESIIPALTRQGIVEEDARDYAIVGCVELSTQGNNLGWSDAAMFNLVKVLELTINDGVCMLTRKQLGPNTGQLSDFDSFEGFLDAYRRQLDHFLKLMMPLCDRIDRLHAELLPSPFLSSVVSDCLENGVDVTAGGARYNLSGIQAIQPANLADGLAALKQLVFDEKAIDPRRLLNALRNDYSGEEELKQRLIQRVPKYGNDVEWVDQLGAQWTKYFAERLSEYTNARGGPYHMGLYTVSAHVPMGKNVGATPDGRRAREPLADGGMSAMYGRDVSGLKSVSRIESRYAGNGTLLNMKFLPRMFDNPQERGKFIAMLRTLGTLGIHHVQFNVVNRETLISARERPEEHRNLTIRVAGYTAYFVELAPDLQEEIIKRTSYGETP